MHERNMANQRKVTIEHPTLHQAQRTQSRVSSPQFRAKALSSHFFSKTPQTERMRACCRLSRCIYSTAVVLYIQCNRRAKAATNPPCTELPLRLIKPQNWPNNGMVRSLKQTRSVDARRASQVHFKTLHSAIDRALDIFGKKILRSKKTTILCRSLACSDHHVIFCAVLRYYYRYSLSLLISHDVFFSR